MLNQVVLVGRIVKDPELMESENGNYSKITLAVPRSYKNSEGEYGTDFVDCTLFNAIASNTVEYCKKGDLVGIKGRIQTNSYEDKDGNNKFSLDIVAEKVTFLTSKSKDSTERSEER